MKTSSKYILWLLITTCGSFFSLAQSISSVNNNTFNEGGGSIIIDSDVSVSGDDNFTGGYLIFDITNSTPNDVLSVATGGSLTISGEYVYWSGSRVGKVHSTYNGQNGNDLRIDFSAEVPVNNSGFETGDVTDWTPNTNANQMCNQIWAEGPLGGGSVDSTPACDEGNSDGTFSVSSTAAYSGGYGLKLEVSGQVSSNCGTNHSPSVVSDFFTGGIGDELSLWYNAAQTSDYSDVFGFIFQDANSNAQWDSGESYQKLFHNTVSTTNGWVNLNTFLTISGSNLRFWFLNGTYDNTCGRAVGSYLYIDDIVLYSYNSGSSTTGQVATNAIVEYIIEHITYNNNCGSNDNNRNFQISINDGSGTGSASGTIIFNSYPPVANCKDITVYLDASGNASISESAVNNSSTDACSITFDTDVTSFSCADVPSKVVTLYVTDSYGNTSSCTSTVTICDIWAPIANNDTYNIYYSETGNITYSLNVNSKDGVLANDTDQPCTISGVNSITDNPDHGNLNMNMGDGRFTFKPHSEYKGTDSFMYNLTDGCNTSGSATVTINILTPTFTNAGGNGLFSNPANWNCEYVPDAESLDIIIAAPGLIINQNYTCKKLQFMAGSSFSCSGGHTLTITDNILNRHGNVAIDVDSPIVVSTSISINNQ